MLILGPKLWGTVCGQGFVVQDQARYTAIVRVAQSVELVLRRNYLNRRGWLDPNLNVFPWDAALHRDPARRQASC